MGITQHVNNLRKRQPHEKKRIALAYSSVITGAIFIVWLSVLLPRGIQHDLAASGSASAGGPSLNDIGGEFQQGANGIQAQFDAAKDQFTAGMADSQTAAAGSALTASAPDDSSGGGLGLPPGAPTADTDANAAASATSAPAKQYDFGY